MRPGNAPVAGTGAELGPCSGSAPEQRRSPGNKSVTAQSFGEAGGDEGDRDRAVAHEMCVQDLSPRTLHNPDPRCFH